VIKLIGILLVAIGFAFRFNTLLVVVVAGVVTGLVGGMHFNDIMTQFGHYFITNRYVTLPIIMTLPVIGMLEHYGLKEHAETMIKRIKTVTTGRVILSYLFIREASSAIGLNIGGQAQAVRPLVAPMAEGAAKMTGGELSEELLENIKAHSAASDNIAYFFGEDIFIATGGI